MTDSWLMGRRAQLLAYLLPIFALACSNSGFNGGNSKKADRLDPEVGAPNDPSAAGGVDGLGKRNIDSLTDADGNDIDLDIEGGVKKLVNLCRDKSKVETKETALNFPSTMGRACQIGRSGEKTFNAATQQTTTFSIPDGSYPCSIGLTALQGSFTYDDTAFLTLNDFVLATSSFNEQHLGPPVGDGGLYVLDVEAIIAKRVDRYGGPGNYCSPDSTCEFPASESAGVFRFELGEAFLSALPAEELKKIDFDVGLTVGGNSEQGSGNRDCQHSGLDLTATIEFVTP